MSARGQMMFLATKNKGNAKKGKLSQDKKYRTSYCIYTQRNESPHLLTTRSAGFGFCFFQKC
jgi:hypothetical protein